MKYRITFVDNLNKSSELVEADDFTVKDGYIIFLISDSYFKGNDVHIATYKDVFSVREEE